MKTQNITSSNLITDLTTKIAAKENEVSSFVTKNKIDTIDLQIKKVEVEVMKNRLEENKLINNRLSKTLKGKMKQDEIQASLSKEKEFKEKVTQAENKIGQLANERKEEARKQRKAENKEKVDKAKTKVKLKLAKNELESKEKSFAKAEKKGKWKPEEKAEKEKEIADLKIKIAEYETQLK
jgi:hypothetical protein